NDIELDEEILIYSVISDESNGLFEMFANGTYSYTPNDGFIGTAYVYYEGCDPCGACNDGLLTIVVTEVVIENYSPVANSITYDICQAQSFALDMDDLISDVESQDAALQITITPPATGNIIYNEFEHTLQYTADVVSADDVEINYTVCDNALEPLCASGTIYVNITASATPNISEVMVTHVDCHGGDDGSIQILALSGVGNLIVTWFDDSHDMEKNNLEAGDYTITVSSDALCNVDGNYLLTVSQPAAPLVASADFVSGISVGVNGAIDISISGGTAPYEIVWIGPGGFFAETEDINELLNTGQYTAYITDLNNCDAQIEVDITDVLELESTFEAQLMPNPADDHSVLLLQGLNGEKISYTITDASGRMVMQSLYNLWPSAHRELIDMNGWASGVYQLKLRTEQKQQVLKLMKQ
ncbi:MAG: Ig-like domain-containing protein, partial [Flavobacteriales bacterium]